MAGVRALIALAFAGCIGLTFLVVGCALPQYNVWWPLFVLTFYVLSPIPLSIVSRYQDDTSETSAATEFAVFVTTGLVVSAFGLPAVLATVEAIKWEACAFVMAGNVVTFLTILAYFYVHREDNGDGWSNGLF